MTNSIEISLNDFNDLIFNGKLDNFEVVDKKFDNDDLFGYENDYVEFELFLIDHTTNFVYSCNCEFVRYSTCYDDESGRFFKVENNEDSSKIIKVDRVNEEVEDFYNKLLKLKNNHHINW